MFDGIGVGRIRAFPFLPIPFTTPCRDYHPAYNNQINALTLIGQSAIARRKRGRAV